MKMRKFAALMLTLCMMLSLSISAFAASDAIASGTIQSSGIRWELDSNGWLTFFFSFFKLYNIYKFLSRVLFIKSAFSF